MFVTSQVYAVLNWRVLDTASAGASGTVTVEDQRSCTKIETLRGKNPTEIHSVLCNVCGEQTVDRSTFSRWATRFREGRVTINDNQRPGCPKTSTDERSVKLVADFLAQDRRATCKEISEAAWISPTSVFRILTNDLQKRKICVWRGPHCFTVEQKPKCLEIASLLKQRFNVEGQAFLYRIVTINETWVRDFELELKSQSNEWRSPTSSPPKKFRWAQSKVQHMMIFAYDHRGNITTDRIPCGTSVTAAYCRDRMQKLRIKMHKSNLTCSGMGHSFCTTMHARTWGRLWSIC